MASLEEIRELLGEPRFNWSDDARWNQLEEVLGVAFPEDFRTFVDAYGPVLINRQLTIGHPGVAKADLGIAIQRDIEVWQDAPDGEVPYPVGSSPGELLPWGSAASGETVFFRVPEKAGDRWTVGVYESDEGEYYEYPMSFTEWMISYLRGEDVTVCSRNFAPDGPFYRPLN